MAGHQLVVGLVESDMAIIRRAATLYESTDVLPSSAARMSYGRAVAAWALGDRTRALHLLEVGRFEAGAGGPAVADFQRGRLLWELGAYQAALDIWRESASVRFIVAGGDTAAEQGRFEAALETYEIAQQLEPDNPAIYKRLGMTYWRLGRWAMAEAAFAEGLRLEPDNPYYCFWLGRVRITQGDPIAGRAVLRQGIALNNDDTDWDVLMLLELAASHRTDGEYEVAECYYKQAQAVAPVDSRPFFYLGRLYLEWKRPKAAVRELEMALALEGKQAPVRYLYWLGEAYCEAGLPDQALAFLEEAASRAPNDEVYNSQLQELREHDADRCKGH